MTKVSSQPSSRTAASTMASNTGCASAGDWLMTRRISALATCRACADFTAAASVAACDRDFGERRGPADLIAGLAARLGTERFARTFLVPRFFFGELPFAEPRP